MLSGSVKINDQFDTVVAPQLLSIFFLINDFFKKEKAVILRTRGYFVIDGYLGTAVTVQWGITVEEHYSVCESLP